MLILPPLSLYIHIPWCVKKCPYCDFNSHALKTGLPETEYLSALLHDLQLDLSYVQDRQINSIFFGGGTPSLISPLGIEKLLHNISKLVKFAADIEITLETNPGTVEHFNLSDYKHAGINRISLGAQSFNDRKLQALGRIHSASETLAVIEKLHVINFNSFNIDLMHGLPQQTVDEAIHDLTTAIDCQAQHISWYQLTLEPNTVFYKYPPQLPNDEVAWQIQTQGEQILSNAGLQHYEVSAFAKPGAQCKHNVNYWEFGDYIGIGAGAHGKMTDLSSGLIQRTWKTRNPKDYLLQFSEVCRPEHELYDPGSGSRHKRIIPSTELPFEFMLNRLRLFDKLNLQQFVQRTGLPINSITEILKTASNKGLIELDCDWLCLTALGKRFLNDVMQMFLIDKVH